VEEKSDICICNVIWSTGLLFWQLMWNLACLSL
jgi:hypothetical protein